jgi:NADH-quinone oxidoreductase subunit A
MQFNLLVGYLLLFVAVGVGFILIHLLMGKVLRPIKPFADKLTIYECGEPTIGSAWVQFDLRYYVVALLFVIFDVEVAFFFPWAVVFGQANTLSIINEAGMENSTSEARLARRELLGISDEKELNRPFDSEQQEKAHSLGSGMKLVALVDILVFFGVLLVGFAYLWKRGDLQWVKTTIAERLATGPPEAAFEEEAGELVGSGRAQ